jgi:hypothetical protein
MGCYEPADVRVECESRSRICHSSPDFGREPCADQQRLHYTAQYITNFGDFLAPSPNYFNLAADVRYLVQNGIRGIFQEGSYQSPGAEMNELKNYVLGRAMFNQTRNVTGDMLGFLNGYYGVEAAPHILEYMTLLQSSMKTHSFNMQWAFPGSTAPYLTPPTVLAAASAFSAARRAATSGLHVEHVNRSAIAMYVRVFSWSNLVWFAPCVHINCPDL